jgi:hypothetical protein
MNALPCLQGEVLFEYTASNRRPVWCRAFALLATLFILGIGSESMQARVIYVNGQLQTDPVPTGQTWATAWGTIGDAVNEASEGDEIWVAQGTYKEFVVITNAVALYGGFAGTETNRDQRNFTWNTTTIYGDGGGTNLTRNVVSILEVTNELARLDGFTVDKDPMVIGSAIYTTNASPVIANNRINGLTNFLYGVIQCQGGAPLITNNHVANNASSGIFCISSDAYIIRNEIIGNKTGNGAAITVSYGAPVIESNDIVGNSSSLTSGGIDSRFSNVIISNNRIINNYMSTRKTLLHSGAGIYTASSTNIMIANNLVMGNNLGIYIATAFGASAGILCDTNVAGAVINNTLINNQADRTVALWCGSTQVLVLNNIIAFNSAGVGGVTNMLFTNNCVYGNGATNYVKLPDLTGTNGNIALDPMLDGDAENPGWHLLPGSPCIGAGDISLVSPDWQDIDGEPRIHASVVDIGADAFQADYSAPMPVIYHVRPEGDDRNDGLSWATAIRTVQSAMDRAALTRKDIWVSAGVYPESVIVRPFVNLYGGFSGVETGLDQRDWSRNTTILDAQGLDSVVQIYFLPGSIGLDGFTIQNGLADNGGGVIAKGCSLRVANNVIQYSVGRYKGGGLYSDNCSLSLSNNLIQGNSAATGGGVAANADVMDLIERNTFKSNLGPQTDTPLPPIFGTGGAGLSVQYSHTKILNNVFIFNSFSNTTPRITLSVYGSALFLLQLTKDDSITNEVCNNTFVGNKAFLYNETGCIAINYSTNTLFANNLLANNSSGLYIPNYTNNLWVNNCVFSNSTYNYRGIPDQTGTNGNIAINALFAAPPLPYLLSNSPCIDAGIALPGIAGELDWAGNPRLVGSATDIGAAEFSSALPPLSRSVYFVSPNGSDTNGGHSWRDAKQTVQAGVDAASAGGGEVWVEGGKYVENLNMPMFVSIYGGFKGDETSRNSRDWDRNPTILDGGAKANVIQLLLAGETSVISGFTIQNSGNVSEGGGILCYYSSPTISDNRIILNRGDSGIVCSNGAAIIINNLIACNTNSVVYPSRGSAGVALISSPDAKVINNTIVSNYANGDNYIGAVFTSMGGLFINNIVAFNNKNGISFNDYNKSVPFPVLSNNCFYGNARANYFATTPGPGDISVDPLFIPGTSQLSADSPCIDAGNDLVITPDMLDLAGTARLQGMHVDIGAFEYASQGDWASFVPSGESVQATPVTVGGITYVPWRFEFAESKYRMVEPGTVTMEGTNITCRFNLEQWSGAEIPGTNVIAGTFVLGALNPGDYTLTVNVSSNDVKTVPFSVSGEKASTLTWQPRADGALKLQVLGVEDVTYRLLCATNLVNWEILSTHRGAPFELEVTNNAEIPTLFYRVEILK